MIYMHALYRYKFLMRSKIYVQWLRGLPKL